MQWCHLVPVADVDVTAVAHKQLNDFQISIYAQVKINECMNRPSPFKHPFTASRSLFAAFDIALMPTGSREFAFT